MECRDDIPIIFAQLKLLENLLFDIHFQYATLPKGLQDPNLNTQPIFADYANGNFTLANDSAGHNAASDGTDMGTNISLVGIQGSGSGDITPPAAPSGLSVQ